MPIHRKILVINRIEKIITDVKSKHLGNKDLYDDIAKLEKSLRDLKTYLTQLDQLAPNYTTNEITHFINAINLDLDLLKPRLATVDYRRIYNGIRVLKTLLKLHPSKYSFIEYAILWLYEMLYFI